MIKTPYATQPGLKSSQLIRFPLAKGVVRCNLDGMSTPRDLAERMRARQKARGDGFIRQTFSLPRAEARKEARAWLDRYPAAAYLSAVESWRELPEDKIEFTMRRLPTAD